MKIGIFDSGVGGLTVLHEAMTKIPQGEFYYYGDLDHVPYGTKDKECIYQLTQQALDYLLEKGLDGFVLACNTATSAAAAELRQHYALPIIGMEPAVKPAIQKSNGKKTLVLATAFTLKEKKLQDLLHRLHAEDRVDLLPMGQLVHLAEKACFDPAVLKQVMDEALTGYHMQDYDTLVLGCTHFVYYKALLQSYFKGSLDVIDGNAGTVNHLMARLGVAPDSGPFNGRVQYFVSGREVDGGHFRPFMDYLDRVAQMLTWF